MGNRMRKKGIGNRISDGVALLLAGISAFGSVACSREKQETLSDDPIVGEETLHQALPTDGSLPTEHTGTENLAYMSYRLKDCRAYSVELQGVVSAAIVKQTVESYKHYKDGVMIMADISKSPMVKTATQFCFVGEAVLRRSAKSSDASDWNGAATEWSADEPEKLSAESYKTRYGLPGTEFSVYVLNEETVLSCSEVSYSETEGTYVQTFELSPAEDGAVYYYRRKMKETGGLDEYPVFEYVRITYTFDGNWRVLSSVFEEKYTAKMFIKATCVARYESVYRYDADLVDVSDYENYYARYI